MMARHTKNNGSDFNVQSITHPLGLWPTMGTNYDDQATDMHEASALTCTRKGQLLYYLSSATQQYKSHHSKVEMSFECSRCTKAYKTKHAVFSPSMKIFLATGCNKDVNCDLCPLEFRTLWFLSKNEMVVHTSVWNEKRQQTAHSDPPRSVAKGYERTWTKENLDLMLQLEIQLNVHPESSKK
jgi:hypothetical protein